MTRKVGIFSGTFDPVHNGHVRFALAAQRACDLDEVTFMPEPVPRYKDGVTPIADRLAMLRLALKGREGLTVHTAMHNQLTVAHTLPELHERYPNSELTFLMGSDVVEGLSRWPSVATLAQQATIAVGLRQDATVAQIEGLLQQLQTELNVRVRRVCIAGDFGLEASSHIRQGSRRTDLDPAVERYIARHQLYV